MLSTVMGLLAMHLMRPPYAIDGETDMRIAAKMICARVGIGSGSYWFVVDSGSYNSVIDPAIAKQLQGTLLAGSKSTQNPGGIIRVPVIQVGAARLRNQCLSVEPTLSDGINIPGTSEKVVGMLGYNLLRFLTLAIDFQECRIWAWGPGHRDDALRLLRGIGKPEPIGRLRTADLQPLLLGGKIGSLPSDSMFDLGAYVSTFSVEFARRLPSRPKLGPVVQTVGNATTGITRLVFVDTLRQGNFSWTGVPFLLDPPHEPAAHPVFGWTLLAPLGRVVVDFSGRTVYGVKPGVTPSSLDTALAIYGTKIKDGELVLRDGKVVPSNTVRSFFGTQIGPKEEFLNGKAWDGPKRSGEAMGRLFDGSSEVMRVQDDSGNRIVRFEPVAKPLRDLRFSGEAEDVPYRAPGHYLKWGNRVVQLPAGELWVSSKGAKVVSIGAVAELKALPSIQGWSRFRIPVSDDSVDVWKRYFGWQIVEGPLVVSQERSWTPKSGSKVAKGMAVSVGSWKTTVSGDGSLSLRGGRKGPE